MDETANSPGPTKSNLGSADHPDSPAIQRQLQRILSSPEFRRFSRLTDFLAYVVEEALEGRRERIKAYSIGIEVLGRDASFDPQVDPVVRVEAGRLRRELERYYLTVGKDDPIGIEIPKGCYVPRFHFRLTATARNDDRGITDASKPARRFPLLGRAIGRREWRVAGVAALLAMLSGGIWLAAGLTRDVSGHAAITADGSTQPSVLILPFANLGGGAEADRRGTAIMDELTARLARFREVTIVSPPRADGSLGVTGTMGTPARYVFDGSIRADASRLRITARLAERASGTVLWSDVYDLDPQAANAIALEQDIASRVADAMAQPYGVLFRPAGQTAPRTSSNEAADGYQCALEFYRYRGDLGRELHAQVRACLQRSVSATPGNATAWAMLAYAYLDEDRYGHNRIASPPPLSRAIEAARRAVQLDPTNVRGLQALMTVLFFNREPEESLRVGEQAYRLNPYDTELLGEYGSRLLQAGERARGMAMMEQAVDRNPANSGLYAGLLALGYYLDGADAKALGMIRRSDLQRLAIYHFVAALIYARNGLADETKASRQAFLEMRPDFFVRFGQELDKRNFNAEDRAKLIVGARQAGFPVPAEVPASTSRMPASRAY